MKVKLDPVLWVVLIAFVVAMIIPARGKLGEIIAVIVPLAIMALFFFHGLRLPREAIIDTLTDLKLQLTILGLTFILYPCLGIIAGELSGFMGVSAGLGVGLVFLTFVPTTVNSSVIYVGLAKGNVAAAVAATASSNMFGILLTPILVLLFLNFGSDGISVEFFGARIERMIKLLLLPFVAGHLSRRWLGVWGRRHAKELALVDRTALGLLIYSALSGAMIDQFWSRVGAADLVITAILCIGILAAGATGAFMAGRLGGFDREDIATVFFCGGQKTMIAGIPMAQILLPANTLGEVIPPMILFHQMELVLASLLVPYFLRAGHKSS